MESNKSFNFATNLKKIIAKKICTACSGTSCKIVPVTTLFKYLHNDTSETEVNINISVNNGSEKLYKKKHRGFATTFSSLFPAHCT
jgi:hypothetical protein